MRVTQVAIRPTEASEAAGRPAFTPELLAAISARYSRNDEGWEAILARVDPDNLDKSVDSIFRMIDYGHQSIADMAPVAMFLDGISIWLAYYLWTLCPTAGGQESSTRYIKLSAEGLIPAEALGIPEALAGEWQAEMSSAFDAYQAAIKTWNKVAARDPSAARIPRHLLNDGSEKAQKQVARMKRNFAFDRARYFLPVAGATNVMLLMSARGWVQLCQSLLSHPLPEARRLGEAVHAELGLCAPRLLRHATAKDSIGKGLEQEFAALRQMARAANDDCAEHASGPALEVFPPGDVANRELADALAFHDNRYAWTGGALRRTAVRFRWDAVAFAEIRDLNRHRTGTKHCPLVPMGFYHAADQLPGEDEAYRALGEVGREATSRARLLLAEGDPSYVYWSLLGTQFPFEHTTTADKFLYEAELRTGTGAHFRYAQHLHDALALWYERYPETRGLVLEGSAEPE
jgi:thymidylate synthase ThyX